VKERKMALRFTTETTHPKMRVHTWINIKTLEPFYSIEANVRYGEWAHVLRDRKVLFFSSKEEAKAEIKRLQAGQP
jgi:hypothetical protein